MTITNDPWTDELKPVKVDVKYWDREDFFESDKNGETAYGSSAILGALLKAQAKLGTVVLFEFNDGHHRVKLADELDEDGDVMLTLIKDENEPARTVLTLDELFTAYTQLDKDQRTEFAQRAVKYEKPDSVSEDRERVIKALIRSALA